MYTTVLNATQTKAKFVKSIYNWLIETLEARGKEQYKDMFSIEGTSIMCNLPANFFDFTEIPANTRIEMKFVSKK